MANRKTMNKTKTTFYCNPNHIAEGLLQSDYVFDPGDESVKGGAWTMAWWRDDYYQWRDGCWYQIPVSEMKRVVTEHIQKLNESALAADEDTEIRITTQTVNNILLCLSTYTRIPENRELNTWPDGREKLYHTLPVNNGLLMRRLSGKEPTTLESHSPKYFSLTKLPYDYDKTAKCPKWLKFLDDVMLGKAEYIRLLKQWVGYLFRPDLSEQKFLLCVGEGANGKGVFFDVIESLVGRDNCSHVPLSRLHEPFSAFGTLGKVLNATNESSHIISDEAENVLKYLVAGDRTSFNRKFKDDIMAEPTAKIMIATNAKPRFNDKTSGVWRRILFVPFDKVIPENEQDKTLAKQLKTELPGILNWALEGLFDLNAAGGFSIPADTKRKLEIYRQESDPARAFLIENYIYSPNGGCTSCQTVYEAYRQWCIDNGFKPLNAVHFGRNLTRIFPNVRKIRPRIGKERINEYEGLVSVDDAAIVNPENGQVTMADELNWPDENNAATVNQKVTMADTGDNTPF